MATQPKIYSREYYERIYAHENSHWWSRGMQAIGKTLLAPYLETGRAWRVLDAGCGTGGTLQWLQGIGISGYEVGIDLSHHALAFCRERRILRVLRASVTDLPFSDQSFDFIACLDVIQHLDRTGGDLQALREFRRVLRPGGVMLLRSNARRSGDGDQSAEADYHRYRIEELAEIFRLAGFQVERLTYVNSLDWWRERIRFRRRSGSGSNGKYSDPGLPLRSAPPGLNWIRRIFYQILKSEGRYLRRADRTLKHGHSTMAVVRRPAEP